MRKRFLEVMTKLRITELETEEDRIDEDFLWLGRNMPSLIRAR